MALALGTALLLAAMTLSARANDDLPAAATALRELGHALRELTPLYGVCSVADRVI